MCLVPPPANIPGTGHSTQHTTALLTAVLLYLSSVIKLDDESSLDDIVHTIEQKQAVENKTSTSQHQGVMTHIYIYTYVWI